MKKKLMSLALTLVTALFLFPTSVLAASETIAFSDVPSDAFYAEPVKWAVKENITSGTSSTTFSPNETCSVAQILAFLHRANGSVEPTISNPFTDVTSSDWFYKSALWAYEKGLVSGTKFNGNTPCTRSTAVTYLWKLANSPSALAASFADVPSNAAYAKAVAWAVSEKITSGTSTSTFSPDEICSRGQIVTFLFRTYANASNSGSNEEVLTFGNNNVEYGTITLSGFLSEGKGKFDFGDGDIRDWNYTTVKAGSTCTITPTGACKYTEIELTTWTLEDGEYVPDYYEFMPWHMLYADGQAEGLAVRDDLENLPLATPEHPAYFVFGKNVNMKSPFGGDACPLELKADGTMYRLHIDCYDESGQYLAGFTQPFFIQ